MLEQARIHLEILNILKNPERKKIIYFEQYPHPDLFKTCIFDAFVLNPACAKVLVHKSASCRSKRVDDHSRFYADIRYFRGRILHLDFTQYIRPKTNHKTDQQQPATLRGPGMGAASVPDGTRERRG